MKKFAFMLIVIVCLFSPLLPELATGSDGDVVITANVFLNPLEVQASARPEVTAGKTFTVKAMIRNNGDLRMQEVTTVVYLPMGLELVKAKAKSKRSTIAAHKHVTPSWKVRALEEGNYVIMVLASGTYDGIAVEEQDVVLFTVR